MIIPTISFEENFPINYYYRWMQDNWHLTIHVGILYLAFVFGGQYYMKNRKPFSLRPYLIVWNIFLSIFSILGTTRVIPNLLGSIRRGGFVDSICTNDFMTGGNVIGFWSWLYVLSKWVELGDTVFIVLRKQPLNFLHWFHHLTTMISVTFCYANGYSIGRWSGTMNYIIHSVMYSYFTLKAMRFAVPKCIAMCITTIQTAQMVVGFALSSWVMVLYIRGEACSATWRTIIVANVIYFLYFLLFVNFFRMSYLRKKKEIKTH